MSAPKSTHYPRLLWITPPEGSLELLYKGLLPLPGLSVLLRRPQATTRQLLSEGYELKQQCESKSIPLLVSRRVDIALLIEAQGVHLPARGISVSHARTLLPNASWIGVSCHDHGDLSRAAAENANYATLSPFASTPGKGPPLGPKRFRHFREGIDLPVLALGGINKETALSARMAGAEGFAFLRAISADPPAQLRELHQFLDTIPASRE